MKIKNKLKLLCILVLVIIVVNLIPYGLRFIDRQEKIDPNNIKNEYDNDATTGIFNNQIVEIPKRSFDDEKVLGESDVNIKSNKRIEVNLANQKTYAFDGDNLVYEFLISSGSWNRTPNGTFEIWTKVKSQKMSGGSKELGTYFYLPNVKNVMFFYNDKVEKKLGYSFHEAYWHNNFGVPMSHGCINMKLADSKQLYEWADIGTKVIITGKYQIVLPQI